MIDLVLYTKEVVKEQVKLFEINTLRYLPHAQIHQVGFSSLVDLVGEVQTNEECFEI